MGTQPSLFNWKNFKRFLQGKRRRASSVRQVSVRRVGKDDDTLKSLWCKVRSSYFSERSDLDHYRVIWSTRKQKRTLAACFLETKTVRVAQELKHPDCQVWLEPILYHEMCHAYLGNGGKKQGQRQSWHGKEFKALEKRHPTTAALDHWIRNGGWSKVVRSDRARMAWVRRKLKDEVVLRRI